MDWESLIDTYLKDNGKNGVYVEDQKTRPADLSISPCSLDRKTFSALANASIVTEREQDYCTMHEYECTFNYADDDNIDPGRFSCVSNYQCDHKTERNECLYGKKYLNIATCFLMDNSEQPDLNETCYPTPTTQSEHRMNEDDWCKA